MVDPFLVRAMAYCLADKHCTPGTPGPYFPHWTAAPLGRLSAIRSIHSKFSG